MASTKKLSAMREEHCALLIDISSSLTTFDVEDEQQTAVASENGRHMVKLRDKSTAPCRRRYHMHRSLWRYARYVICALPMMMLFLLLYLPIYTDVQNRHVGLPDWSFNASRDIKDYIQPLEDTTLIRPRDFCRNKALVLIAVCSGLNNFVQRQTIRDTWGNTTDFNYASFKKLHAHLKGRYLKPTDDRLKVYASYLSGKGDTMSAAVRIVFFVGRSNYESLLGNETLTRLHSEAEQYQDIIQENFIDSYNNLTLKSVLALKEASKHCADSAFFLKCDDDTFVNVPNLLHFLLGGTVPLYNDTLEFYDLITVKVMAPENRLNDSTGVLRGHQFCSAHPISDVTSKWYMPYYMFPQEAYPKYLSGAGYLMSMDVVNRLYESALNTTLIYLEDIFITALCAERAQIKRQHHPLFSYTHSRRACAFKGVITQHEMKDDSMVEAWQFVSNYTIKCPPPDRYFKQIRLRKRLNC